MRLVMFFLFFSCAVVVKDPVRRNGKFVERETIIYIESFEKNCNRKVNLNIHFANLDGYAAGVCTLLGYGDIYVDYEWWERNPYYFRREELLFHEFGHCVLGRRHDDSYLERREGMFFYSFEKKSLMSSNLFYDGSQYINNRQYYINELCHNDIDM